MFSKIIGKRKCTKCNTEFDQTPQIFCSSKCIIIDYFLSIGRVGTVEEAKKFAEEIFKEYFRQYGG